MPSDRIAVNKTLTLSTESAYSARVKTNELAPCGECGTPVPVLNAEITGKEMRFLRRQRGLTGTQVSEAMGVTRAYVSLLELGNAPWTHVLVERYKAAVQAASAKASADGAAKR